MENEQNKKNKKSLWNKLRAGALTLVKLIFNPRLLLCFGIAWLITNGWSYIMLGIGSFVGIKWMVAVSSTYLTLLWLPFTPEKIITVIIAIWLLTRLFPKDEKTLAVLREELQKAKAAVKRCKKKKQKSDLSPREDE